MQKAHTRLTIAILFTALALLAYFGTHFVSGFIDVMYRNASGLTSLRSVAQAAALLSAIALILVGLIIAVRAALQPARAISKLVYAVPLFLLTFTIAAIISGLLGIGTVGNLTNLQGIGAITFAPAWTAVGAVLSTIAVVIAAARTRFGSGSLRRLTWVNGIAVLLTLIAAGAMIASVAVVSASEPNGFGAPDGGFPPNRQGAPNFDNQNPLTQTTTEAPSGFPAPQGQDAFPSQEQSAATVEAPSGLQTQQERGGVPQDGTPQNGGSQNGAPREGRDGQFPPGGPGGFGNSADVASRYTIGGILTAIFAVIALRGLPASEEVSEAVPLNYQHEVGFAVLSVVVLTVIVVAVIQVVPVSRENPPVQTALNWDSAETQDLAYRVCMDCHSNETTWPWYAYIAPASWLTTVHVNAARQELNFSELASMPTFRKSMITQQISEQIRSGAMPPADYLLLHPEARLTHAEKQALIQGFQQTLAGS